MRQRKTPIGLVIGLVVVGTTIFTLNILSHREPSKAPAPSTTNLQDTTAEDLKSHLASQVKGGEKHGRPKMPGGRGMPGLPNPQDSMLMKPPTPKAAPQVEKPKQDFSGQVVGGWYDKESGVPKPN